MGYHRPVASFNTGKKGEHAERRFFGSPASRPEVVPGPGVGGLAPLTTIDFPGRLAAVVFCQGCPWRCVYCHNPHLIPANAPPALAWEDALAFLERRRGLLDGVVFSGGEPTLQAALPEAMREVRALGFQVACIPPACTRSGSPPCCRWWTGWAWISRHRAPPTRASPAPRCAGDAVFESLSLILAAGVEHELRCTWPPGLLSSTDLARLDDELRAMGADRLVIQECRAAGRASALPGTCRADPDWAGATELAGRYHNPGRARPDSPFGSSPDPGQGDRTLRAIRPVNLETLVFHE
jgi:pyruvate formate lyase activating enzyme